MTLIDWLQDIIVPYQQGEIIQMISSNVIRTQAIEGASHVTYVHNDGKDFSEVDAYTLLSGYQLNAVDYGCTMH